ncbi:MAG: hypothetical protein ACE5HJ_03085 [Thermoplasmata archaeon]
MEVITRKHPWYTILPFTTIVAFLLTLTGYWQLIFGAGLLAGILMKRAKDAFIIAFLAGVLAWGLPLTIASAYYPLADASVLLLRILGLSPSLVLLPYIIAILISGFGTALGGILGVYTYALLRQGRTEIGKMR